MTKPMTPEQLAEIKARCEAATEGPWRAVRNTGVRNDGGYVVFSKAKPSHYPGQDERHEREIGEWHANLDLIAHARQDLPVCLDEIERLQKVVDASKQCCAFECDECDKDIDCKDCEDWNYPYAVRKALEQIGTDAGD